MKFFLFFCLFLMKSIGLQALHNNKKLIESSASKPALDSINVDTYCLPFYSFETKRTQLSNDIRSKLIEMSKKKFNTSVKNYLNQLQSYVQTLHHLNFSEESECDLHLPDGQYDNIVKLNHFSFYEHQKRLSIINTVLFSETAKKNYGYAIDCYSKIVNDLNFIKTSSDIDLFSCFRLKLQSIADNYKKYKMVIYLLDDSIQSENEGIPFSDLPLHKLDKDDLKFIPIRLIGFNKNFVESYKNQIELLSKNTDNHLTFITNFYQNLRLILANHWALKKFYNDIQNNPGCFETINQKCSEIKNKLKERTRELKKQFFEKLRKTPSAKFIQKKIFPGPIDMMPYDAICSGSGKLLKTSHPFLTANLTDTTIHFTGVHLLEFKKCATHLKPIDNNYILAYPTKKFETTTKAFKIGDINRFLSKNYFFTDKNGLLYIQNPDSTHSLVVQINFCYEESAKQIV